METVTEHKLDRITLLFDHDSDPDISFLEGERLRQYRDNLFYFGGVYALAKIDHIRKWPNTGGYQLVGQSKYTSSGLWGIESDSDPEYLDEIGTEQLAELIDILHDAGYSDQDIQEAADFNAAYLLDRITS